jgi:small-conductance mechanosensitive channel
MDETLLKPFQALPDWLTQPFVTVGTTQISLMRLLALGLIIVLAWWLSKQVEHGLQRLADRLADENEPGSGAGAYAFSRVARYLVWVLATVIGLTSLGFDLTSLAILGGAIGVGLGIGLQGFFGNLFAGLVILFERSVKVGDFVDLQSGVMGRVSEISMRYTRITTNDSVDMFVPNSELTGGRVINWSYGQNYRRIHVPFGVAYGTSKDLVREAGIAAANTVEGTIFGPGQDPEVWLVGFGDSSLDFELIVWVSRNLMISPGRTQARYLWAIESELAARGIEIPFPQRDLHLKSGTLRIDGPRSSTTAQVEGS